MRVIADLHIHSKYSRATSPRMIIDELARWSSYKGINLIGTGDFTHPLWYKELQKNLYDLDNGLYISKTNKNIRFILTAEISCIYSYGGKVRKIHTLVLAPSLKKVEKINSALSKIGNIYSDGRPILGLSAKDLTKIILNIDPRCLIVPAHMWTPWFSLFGSNSGFDNLKECYGELSEFIYAGETGLSSDPEMNWRLSQLDNISLLSNSDAHSPANLGREANVFEVENYNYSYDYITEIIRSKNPKYFPYTIEFFPEEGKYHFDGHRNCNINFHPNETKKHHGICPVCKKPLTIGVYNQVNKLADREEGYIPKNVPTSKLLVPLQEIIAETMGVVKTSKKVQEKYLEIIEDIAPEFEILLDIPIDKLSKTIIDPKIIQGISNVRNNIIKPVAGYDGVYGIIKVLNSGQEKFIKSKDKIKTLERKLL